ncbi:MAG TPA: hypothetical protein VI522_03185 [Gammaproteobacteria bacterium]|nr:hypothetical protein [Gammaproteobacteria bacterium]
MALSWQATKDFFKENVSYSVFDALSPGAEREVYAGKPPTKLNFNPDDNDPLDASFRARASNWVYDRLKRAANWGYHKLFPEKRYVSGNYGWSDLFIRIFLGETQHVLFDLLSKGNALQAHKSVKHQAGLARYLDQIKSLSYAWKESFFIGHGEAEQRGKFNILAVFNPFSWLRALDHFIIHLGFKAIVYAQADKVKTGGNRAQRGGAMLAGLLLLTMGAILRMPRVLIQYVVGATVSPLWNCYKFNKTHELVGEKTHPLGWALATFLTLVNIAFIVLTIGLAAPLVSVFSNKAGEHIAKISTKLAVVNVIGDSLIAPVTNLINDNTTVLASKLTPLPATQTLVAATAERALALPLSKTMLANYPGYLSKGVGLPATANSMVTDADNYYPDYSRSTSSSSNLTF